MSEKHAIGRRQVLTGAGVAAGVAVAGLGFASPADASDGQGSGLSGSWLIVRQDDGTPAKIKAVFSFAGGSVLIEHDINPAGPPFTGTWAASEGNRFRATMWSGTTGQGPNQPGPTVRVKLRGQKSHNTISGKYTFTAFDPTSNAVVQSGTGTFTGSPISA
ncbi:MAG TPA: twin-arginine translocation signal domain-containing protein [Jatrophihabitans sp.]|jgi:hypothetical protein